MVRRQFVRSLEIHIFRQKLKWNLINTQVGYCFGSKKFGHNELTPVTNSLTELGTLSSSSFCMPLSPNWVLFFLLLAELCTLLLLVKLGTLFGHYVGKHFGHHVGHLIHLHVGPHVHLHVGHRNVVSTLCEVSETLTEWKSESVTDGLTEVGARDTCVSKKSGLIKST